MPGLRGDADLRGQDSWEAVDACREPPLAGAYRLMPPERGSPETCPGRQART